MNDQDQDEQEKTASSEQVDRAVRAFIALDRFSKSLTAHSFRVKPEDGIEGMRLAFSLASEHEVWIATEDMEQELHLKII